MAISISIWEVLLSIIATNRLKAGLLQARQQPVVFSINYVLYLAQVWQVFDALLVSACTGIGEVFFWPYPD